MIQFVWILYLSLLVASLRIKELNEECCTELILQKTTEQGPTDHNQAGYQPARHRTNLTRPGQDK